MEKEQKSSSNVRGGGLLVVLAMVIFGSFGIAVRFIQADTILLLWSLQVVGAIIFLLYLLKNRTLFDRHGKFWLIALMTALITVSDLSFFSAVRATTVPTAVFVKYLMPIFVVTFAFRSSKATIKKLVASVGLGTAGLFLVLSSQGGLSITANIGIFYALVTAITLAIYLILFKRATKTLDLSTILFYRYAIASIGLLILLPFIASSSNIPYQIKELWPWLLGFGLSYAVIGTIIHAKGIELTKIQHVAILGYIEPLSAVIMSIWLLGEDITIPLILGGALILLGSGLALKKEKVSPDT